MTIEDNDEIESLDDLEPDEDSLLFSTSSGPRIFTLNNATSTTMLGVLLEETPDSFLVALPSRLMEDGGELSINPFLPVPYIRLMKNSVLSVLYLFGAFKEKYIPYIIENGVRLYPEIEDIVEDLKALIGPEETITADPEVRMAVGMDHEQLQEYLTEKLNKGELVYGNGLKH